MRVGIVTPRYPPTYAGGGEISAQLLANHLAEAEAVTEVEVLSFDGTSDCEVEGVRVRRLADVPQYPYTLPNEIAYRKLQEADLGYDVLHAYNMHLHPAVGRLSAATGVPAAGTLNAYPLLDWADVDVTPSLQRRAYESTLLRVERPRLRRLMNHLDVFLPLSSPVERVYREFGLDGEFRVIPNMTDPSFSVPNGVERDSSDPTLLYVGYLRDSKGVRYLIDAMAHLPPRYALRIVGDGPEREALERRASASDRADRISFAGKVPYEEVTRAYAMADIFVHPGVWPEPFGRTILEAMQAGLPVVATDVGGPAETVPQSALRCRPRDPERLSESIRHAYEHRAAVGRENESSVASRYHPREVVPRFVDVYEGLTEGR